MSSNLLLGEKKKLDVSSSYLKMRLDLNKKDQSKDFQVWLKKKLTVINVETIKSLSNKRSSECFKRYAESFQISFKKYAF